MSFGCAHLEPLLQQDSLNRSHDSRLGFFFKDLFTVGLRCTGHSIYIYILYKYMPVKYIYNIITLWQFNIAIDNCQFSSLIFPLNMVMFHRFLYVCHFGYRPVDISWLPLWSQKSQQLPHASLRRA